MHHSITATFNSQATDHTFFRCCSIFDLGNKAFVYAFNNCQLRNLTYLLRSRYTFRATGCKVQLHVTRQREKWKLSCLCHAFLSWFRLLFLSTLGGRMGQLTLWREDIYLSLVSFSGVSRCHCAHAPGIFRAKNGLPRRRTKDPSKK